MIFSCPRTKQQQLHLLQKFGEEEYPLAQLHHAWRIPPAPQSRQSLRVCRLLDKRTDGDVAALWVLVSRTGPSSFSWDLSLHKQALLTTPEPLAMVPFMPADRRRGSSGEEQPGGGLLPSTLRRSLPSAPPVGDKIHLFFIQCVFLMTH